MKTRTRGAKAVFLGTALLALAGLAQANPVISFVPGTLFDTAAISSSDVSGEQMAGMTVTACNIDNACRTSTWAAGTLGSQTGGAVDGLNFSLTQTADSFSGLWMFESVVAYSRFTIIGRPGGIVFDTVLGSNQSPGSANGRPFTINQIGDFANLSLAVTYTDQLYVGGRVYDDLYTVMTVDWGRDVAGVMTFLADTDSAVGGSTRINPLVPAPPNPNPNPVPLPGTLALVGAALLGLGLTRRRRG